MRLDDVASRIVKRESEPYAYQARTYIKIRQGLTLQDAQNIHITSAH